MKEKTNLLTVAQAAEELAVSDATVYRLIHANDLESVRVRSAIRVPEAAIKKYLARQERQPRSSRRI